VAETRRGLDNQQISFSAIPNLPEVPVPVVATTAALRAMRVQVGGTTTLNIAGNRVRVMVLEEVGGVPGTAGAAAAVLADLPALTTALSRYRAARGAQEHWVATLSGDAAATAARQLPGVEVFDRRAIAADSGRDPYGVGGRAGLFAAALGALLLALIGLTVDVRATARRRIGEFAVLQTMGAGSRLLVRALLAEQAFLAGLGVVVGLLVGVLVAATMAPLVILTPSAARPEPVPLLEVPWAQVGAIAGVLFAIALFLSGLIATTLRQRLAAAQLRIGEDR
jgi:hypothetical protein